MKRFATGLACALVLLWTASALAHDPPQNAQYGRNGQYGNAGQYAYDNGYRDGLEHGRSDRASGRGYDYRDANWRRGDRGYDRRMGSQGQYKQVYRDAYQRGYEEGYNGRGAYGGNGGVYGRGGGVYGGRDQYPNRYPERDGAYGRQYPNAGGVYGRGDRGGYGGYGGYGGANDIAYSTGYNEGLAAGRDDVNDGDRYDPHRHNQYKNADRGYQSSYGSKDAYKQRFREGYLRGYDEAYRRGR